jgi:hypothetical protein
MQNELATYQLLEGLPSNSGELKYILDTVNAKYNNTLWRAFTDVLPASRSKKFTSIVEETGIIVKASVLGSEGVKPLRSLEGASVYSDSIHKIGHGMKMSQTDLTDIMEMNLVDANIGQMLTERYMRKANMLVGGFHATWNSWICEALSTQQIVLKAQGAASGYTIDLRTPAANKISTSGTAAWFDNDTTKYSVYADLKIMDKAADDLGMPMDRVFVCSKTLYDNILADTDLVTLIKARMPLQNATNAVLTDNEILAGLAALGLPPIVAIDEKSRYEVDGVPTLASASFDVTKISLIPTVRLFNMHNSPSEYALDTNPSVYTASFEGGLIGAIEKFASDPISVITNMESWSFPSFKNPKWIVSLDTTATA